MKTLWLRNNKLIVDSVKRPILCGDCPCDNVPISSSSLLSSSAVGSSSTVIVDCAQCPGGMPRCWEITVAGISDLACTNATCSELNGTFILIHNGSCTFSSREMVKVCSGSTFAVAWQMRFETTQWTLRARHDSVSAGAYTLSSGNPCNGDTLTFSKPAGSGQCTGYPLSITATPVSCPP